MFIGSLRHAAAVCCALCLTGATPQLGFALAQPPAAPAPPAESPSIGLVGLAPSDARIVIATRNLDEVLKQAEGTPVAAAVKRLGLLSSSQASVQQLGQQLGWSQDVVVDRLFGGVCMLAMLDDGEGKPWRWMLVSSITPDTADLLGNKLQAVPADAVAGVPSLSIERGRYALIVRDRPAAMGDAGRSRRTRVIGLTPRGEGSALPELARTLVAGEGDTIAKRGVTGTLKTLAPGHVTVLVRPAAAPAQSWSSFTAVTARAGRAGWTADVVLADPAFAVAAAVTIVPPALAGPDADAIVAITERRLPASMPWCLRLLESYDPAPEAVAGQRCLVAASVAPGAIAVQLLSAMTPAPADAAWADTRMSQVLAHLEGNARADNACNGIAPEAVRTTSITLAPASMPRAALGAEQTLSWRTRGGAAGQEGSIIEAVMVPGVPAGLGWMVAPARPVPGDAWLASGWIRPAAAVASLPQDLVARLNVLGLADLASSCDRLEWSFRIDREANPPVVRGRVEARPAVNK